MQPRSLDQILGELDTVYKPQIDSVRSRQAALPEQYKAEEAGLQAKQGQAYDEILAGARRRGIGAGGIPLGEQAKYAATEYMPALARLRTSHQETARSLDDVLNGIYEKRLSFGNQLKHNEDSLYESRRQFDSNLAFQREQEANRIREAARASAAMSAMPTLGGITPSQPGQAGGQAPKTNSAQQKAYDFAKAMGSKGPAAVVSDFRAARAYYEKTGNQNDLIKLQIYKQLYPDILGNATWKQPKATY